MVVSGCGTVCSIVFAYLAFVRNKRKDEVDQGAHGGTILTEIGYIKSGIDDIKKKQEGAGRQVFGDRGASGGGGELGGAGPSKVGRVDSPAGHTEKEAIA